MPPSIRTPSSTLQSNPRASFPFLILVAATCAGSMIGFGSLATTSALIFRM